MQLLQSKCPLSPCPTVCIVYNMLIVLMCIQLIISQIIMEKQVNIFVFIVHL